MRYVLYAILLYLLYFTIRYILKFLPHIINKYRHEVKVNFKEEKSKIDRSQIEDADFEEIKGKGN